MAKAVQLIHRIPRQTNCLNKIDFSTYIPTVAHLLKSWQTAYHSFNNYQELNALPNTTTNL